MSIFNGFCWVANFVMDIVGLRAWRNMEEPSIILEEAFVPLIRIWVKEEKSHVNPPVVICCHVYSSCFSACVAIRISFARPSLRIVEVSLFRFYSSSNSQRDQSCWFDSVVIQNNKICVETCISLYLSHLKIGPINQLHTHKPIIFIASRFSEHDVKFWYFISKRNSRNHISSKINE